MGECVWSVERWRRAWREGGLEGLRSAGPANSPTISDSQFAVLEEELGKGQPLRSHENAKGQVRVWLAQVAGGDCDGEVGMHGD